jgi:chromosome partitioning protein
MALYVIGGQKGGTGKSTLATNLAVAFTLRGRDTLLVDTDRQHTASHWSDVRASSSELRPVTTLQKTGKLFQALRDLEDRYDEVIVDAGGFDSVELRTALCAADHLYSPVRASQSDLWTLEAMAKLVESASELNSRLRAHLVLSMAPTNPAITETRDAIELLREYAVFGICRSVVRDRKAFRDAMFQGRGVLELGDRKAAEEIHAFAEEVIEHVAIPQALAEAS